MTDESRKAFEEYKRKYYSESFFKWNGDEYEDEEIQLSWETWQACEKCLLNARVVGTTNLIEMALEFSGQDDNYKSPPTIMHPDGERMDETNLCYSSYKQGLMDFRDNLKLAPQEPIVVPKQRDCSGELSYDQQANVGHNNCLRAVKLLNPNANFVEEK